MVFVAYTMFPDVFTLPSSEPTVDEPQGPQDPQERENPQDPTVLPQNL
jgi:hypothetical protein